MAEPYRIRARPGKAASAVTDEVPLLGDHAESHRGVHVPWRVVRVDDEGDRARAVRARIGDGMVDERGRDAATAAIGVDEEVLHVPHAGDPFPRCEVAARLAAVVREPPAHGRALRAVDERPLLRDGEVAGKPEPRRALEPVEPVERRERRPRIHARERADLVRLRCAGERSLDDHDLEPPPPVARADESFLERGGRRLVQVEAAVPAVRVLTVGAREERVDRRGGRRARFRHVVRVPDERRAHVADERGELRRPHLVPEPQPGPVDGERPAREVVHGMVGHDPFRARMRAEVTLEAELAVALEAVRRGSPAPDFASWALRIFAHQFERNAPYRAFCARRGISPVGAARWEDVPPVPTAAFRRVDLACGEPEAVFRTSGTTDAAAPGRHLVPHLALYRASALAAFERFVLPDGFRLACICLLPARPDSSLVQMCSWVGEALAASVEWIVDAERVLDRLADAEARGDAMLLLGVTAAFAQVFDACRARRRTFRLGPASRVVDTGGQKGLRRPLSRAAFLRECWTAFGIPGYYCVNEYGMTELCSQRYDSVLDDRFHGRSLAPRRLVAPPWLRTRVLDPDTLAEVAPGTPGLLCHHDLANAGSVSVVLTEDIGRAIGDDGIELLGRAPGAPPRGCSRLLADLDP